MNTRINIGSSVTGAVRYVMHEAGRDYTTGQFKKAEPGQDRVAWIAAQNFGFEVESREDADLARRVMEYDALHRQSSKTRRIELDCVHITLSWRPDEKPSKDEMIAAAKGALAALGMEKARAIFTSHTDEKYAHVHIVASKINPETGLAFDQKENFLKLSKWAQQHEAEHGGIISIARARANELRDAIEARHPKAVLESLTARTPTFTERQLDNALAKKIKDVDERAQFRDAILSLPELVRLKDPEQPRHTTRAVLEDEQMLLNAATTLAGANHRIAERHIKAVLRSDRFRQRRDAEGKLERGITDEQLNAVRHASGSAGIVLISGQAGTGKSFTVDAVRRVHELAGYKVIGLAPTNAVTRDMRAGGFASARTVHSQLMALNNHRQSWDRRTAVIVDEAAMLDTKLMTMLATHAREAGAKLILVGHDKQLGSITRGGMFSVLTERFGQAELTEVIRQFKADERRASELMAEGNFLDALGIYNKAKAIHWNRTQEDARAALVIRWAEDSAAAPEKNRFVFAYTNEDVATLNAELRDVRKQRGELGEDHQFTTARGQAAFSTGDRILFTEQEKTLGVVKGNTATIERIDGNKIAARLGDGRRINFDASAFNDFQHGYAGTIYKGQGKTFDRSYLYHTEHWKADAAYVSLTRHREQTEIFVATNTIHPGYAREPWMAKTGGAPRLGAEDFEAARKSFEKLVARGDYHFGFERYVRYVQDRWAAQERPTQDDHAAHLRALAKQMGRVNENWGASTYELEDGQKPVKVPYWFTAHDVLARWSARDGQAWQAFESTAKPQAAQPAAQEPAAATAERSAPEARPAAQSPAAAPPEAAQQVAANENKQASQQAAPKLSWWRRLFGRQPEEQSKSQPEQEAQPTKPTPILDQWVAAEVGKAARARAHEPRQPEEQGQRQKVGDAMAASTKATTGTTEERMARFREEMAAWRAEITRQQQQNRADLRRLEIEERQQERIRQAREPLSREERDRQLMTELYHSGPSLVADWEKARKAIVERPELFEQMRLCARDVGPREAVKQLPAIMARLEPQRPRREPRPDEGMAPHQDDDSRPRPRSGPAPRMRFDPW